MATYLELYGLLSGGDDHTTLLNRVTIACIVAAETIRGENIGTANHDNRFIWAKEAFQDPTGKAREMLPFLLATNKDTAVASIISATDAVIQTAVDTSINVFADGT
jgi:hypothetical protein